MGRGAAPPAYRTRPSGWVLAVALAACDGAGKPPEEGAPPPDSGGPVTPTDTSTESGTPPVDSGTPPDPDPCVSGVAAVVDGVGYPSIAYGLAAAPTRGRVEVCPGVWPANLHIVRDVTLSGRGDELDAVLDGQFLDRVITVDGADLTLERVTVQNGTVDGDGGGIAVIHYGSLVARHVRVVGNTATGDGGGIASTAVGPVHLYSVEVADNSASRGGGLHVGGWTYNDDDLTGFRVDIHDNHAEYAGGVCNNLENSGSWFFASTIHDNTAESVGGIGPYASDFLLSDLSHNTATVQYGAANWDALILGGTVDGNSAPLDPDFPSGETSLLGVELNGEVVSTLCDRSGCTTLEAPRADARWTPPELTEGSDPPGCETGAAALVGGVGFGSVADAVAAAGEGGVVDVCSGTWPANLVITGTLTLRGTAGADEVILDGDGLGGVIEVDPRGALTLEGLSVTGGYAGEGAGIYVEGALDAVGIVVRDNLAMDKGGGIAVHNAVGPVRLRGSWVYHNAARAYGGGLYLLGTAAIDLSDTVFASNVGQYGGGAALSVQNDDTILQGVSFWGNIGYTGGGVYANSPNHTIRWEGCTLRDNVAGGGGAVFLGSGSLVLGGGAVVGNRAEAGGGAACLGDTLTSDGVDWGAGVDDNRVDDVGVPSGAAYADAPASFSCDCEAETCG